MFQGNFAKIDPYPQIKRLFRCHGGNQLCHEGFLPLRRNDIMKTAP